MIKRTLAATLTFTFLSLMSATLLSLSFVLIPFILLSFVWVTPFIIWPSIGHWQPPSLSWQKRNTLWQDNGCLSLPYPKNITHLTPHHMCLKVSKKKHMELMFNRVREKEKNDKLQTPWLLIFHFNDIYWFAPFPQVCFPVVCRRLFSLEMNNDEEWFDLHQAGFAMCKIQAMPLPNICNICSFGPSIFQLENICKTGRVKYFFVFQCCFWLDPRCFHYKSSLVTGFALESR